MEADSGNPFFYPLPPFCRWQERDVLKANFYKCGDKLSVPHYLSWNPVTTEKPDFHRPEYFGLLEFA